MTDIGQMAPGQPEPPLSDEEQTTKDAFDAYGLGLGMWLLGIGAKPGVNASPVAGTWELDDDPGLLVFTESEFTWIRDRAEPNGDHLCGTYAFMPGAPTVNGYVLSRDGDCYSLFQHYTAESRGQVTRAVNYYGVFIVERVGDTLLIANQRTDGRLVGRLVPAQSSQASLGR